MSHVIAVTFRFLVRQLGSLLLIVVVLGVGLWAKSEWDRFDELQKKVAADQALLEQASAELAWTKAEQERLASEWRKEVESKTRPLRQKVESLDTQIDQVEARWRVAIEKFADLSRLAEAARRAASDARAELARRERERHFWDPVLNPDKEAALIAARATQPVLDANAAVWKRALDSVPPPSETSPANSLRKLRSAVLEQIAQIERLESPLYKELEARRQNLTEIVGNLGRALAKEKEELSQMLLGRLLGKGWELLPVAFWILAAALAVPLLIKAFFYFVLAPLAGCLRPICILPGAQAAAIPAPSHSAVSVALDIDAADELLVHADFLQSSSRTAQKRTQWFLNADLPFASLASGMYMLTRIRPKDAPATRVVVSSQHDPFGEVGVIDLPAGAAVVLQPRSLAGVVKLAGSPLCISRHWRLGSLHAWLTLQLRYLVFHGPCRLVLKGCRGVRAERPDPGQPRLVNQSATLGFSANLDYQTTRCETFVSYLRGQEELFNDLFGGPGWYFYEERPSDGRRTGVTGPWLGGPIDAALKVFGI